MLGNARIRPVSSGPGALGEIRPVSLAPGKFSPQGPAQPIGGPILSINWVKI